MSFRQLTSSRRLFFILLMGFASGLPFALIRGTLQAWMKSEMVDLKVIGLFALVRIPYSFKYLWAPLLDRYVPPLLGRRRGWMAVLQLSLLVFIGVMGMIDPRSDLLLLGYVALAIAFVSASQDIVIDAYRPEILPREQYGLGASLGVFGYRLGMLTSGSLALILADHMAWGSVYLIMAGVMSLCIVVTFLAEEPTGVTAPRTLKSAVVSPFVQFFTQPAAFEVLCFIILYKLGDVMAAELTTPFMLELGFSNTDIGLITKGVGLLALILGSLLGGIILSRIGLKLSLIYFGILQAVATASLSILAFAGKNYVMMAIVIGLDNLCIGMGTAAFVALLMNLCDRRFTATQYALLTSFSVLSSTVAGTFTGFLAVRLGWTVFFLACAIMALPGLLMLYRFDRWSVRFEKVIE